MPMPDKELISTLVDSISALKRMVPYIESNTNEVGKVDIRLQAVEEQTQRLIRLIYEGTGSQLGLMQQTMEFRGLYEQISEQLSVHRLDDEAFHKDVKETLRTIMLYSENMKKLRVQVYLGILAFLGVCLTALVTFLVKK
jgi:hypothetical protein